MERRVQAVILAGGAARRFGQDKAFALWEGQTFLERVGAAVRPVSDGIVILSRPGSKGIDYARLVPGATVIPDHAESAGPVVALQGAVQFLLAPTILIVPVDAPGLPSALARRLVALSEEGRRATVAADASGPMFTIGAIPRALLIERLPSARRLEDLFRDAEPVPTDATGLNVNEPPR